MILCERAETALISAICSDHYCLKNTCEGYAAVFNGNYPLVGAVLLLKQGKDMLHLNEIPRSYFFALNAWETRFGLTISDKLEDCGNYQEWLAWKEVNTVICPSCSAKNYARPSQTCGNCSERLSGEPSRRSYLFDITTTGNNYTWSIP